MKSTGILSILGALSASLAEAKATADENFKKICRVSENLRAFDDNDDANSCRAIAVGSQAHEYQIGCRDSEGPVILTAPFNITDKAARVTSSKLAANTQNTATPRTVCEMRKGLGESVSPAHSDRFCATRRSIHGKCLRPSIRRNERICLCALSTIFLEAGF
jgi:hypothetical protein